MCILGKEFAFLQNNGEDVCGWCVFPDKEEKAGGGIHYLVTQGLVLLLIIM